MHTLIRSLAFCILPWLIAACATSTGKDSATASAAPPSEPAVVAVSPQLAPSDAPWVSLFNGTTLAGWTPKIRGLEVGEDPARTFRVEDGLLTVNYENYTDFNNQFGHLFYKTPYSFYRLRLQYRFLDEQAPGAPDWAYKNSGVMIHSQAPQTMPAAQDFPISIEVQFLGGRGDGQPRPTANMCSPGTHIVYQGEFTDTHCIVAAAPTFHGQEWVDIEVVVKQDTLVEHYVNGEQVMRYGGLTTGGGVVSGHRPELKPEGEPLTQGYISLQSEGHPIQFRNIEIQNLGS